MPLVHTQTHTDTHRPRCDSPQTPHGCPTDTGAHSRTYTHALARTDTHIDPGTDTDTDIDIDTDTCRPNMPIRQSHQDSADGISQTQH